MNRLKKKKIVLGILVGILMILIGVYLGISLFFHSHFITGTTINGADVSKMTVQQAKKAQQDHISEYILTIKERGGNTEKITADQLGLTYVDDKGVEKLLKEQKAFLWPVSAGKRKNYELAANVSYDKSIVDGILEGLSCLQSDNQTPPQDAFVQPEDNGFAIVPENPGSTLKRDDMKNAVINAIDTGKEALDLEKEDLYEKPSVVSTDESLKKDMDQMNALTTANITYDFGDDRKFTADRSVIKDWLVKGDDGNYTVDESGAAKWVKQMAYETDTFGLARDFTTHSGQVIQLPYGGDYGWLINQKETTSSLIEAIQSGTQETREPEYTYKGMDRLKNDIGGTYVEISISEQKMWCYKDGQLIVETPVITGNHSTGHDTPSGHVWAIDAKKRDADFKRYPVHVNFWLPFNGDVGIHDASWRTEEMYTPTFYQNSGSHGCINTPVDAAEKIFNTVGIGSPVIVYYSTDQVVGPQPTQENSI